LTTFCITDGLIRRYRVKDSATSDLLIRGTKHMYKDITIIAEHDNAHDPQFHLDPQFMETLRGTNAVFLIIALRLAAGQNRLFCPWTYTHFRVRQYDV